MSVGVDASKLNNIISKTSNGLNTLSMLDSPTYLDPVTNTNVDEDTQKYTNQIIKNHIDPVFETQTEQLKGLIIDGFVSYMTPNPDPYFEEFLEMIFDQIVIGRIRELVFIKKRVFYLKLFKFVLERIKTFGISSKPEYASIHQRIIELFTIPKTVGGTTTITEFLYPLNYIKDISKTVSKGGIEYFIHKQILEGVYTYFTEPRLNNHIKGITPNLFKLIVKVFQDIILDTIQKYDYEQCIVLLYALLLDPYLTERIQSIKPILGGSNDGYTTLNGNIDDMSNIIQQLDKGMETIYQVDDYDIDNFDEMEEEMEEENDDETETGEDVDMEQYQDYMGEEGEEEYVDDVTEIEEDKVNEDSGDIVDEDSGDILDEDSGDIMDEEHEVVNEDQNVQESEPGVKHTENETTGGNRNIPDLTAITSLLPQTLSSQLTGTVNPTQNTNVNDTVKVPTKYNVVFVANSIIDHFMKKLLGMLADGVETNPASEPKSMLNNLATSIQNRVNYIMSPKNEVEHLFQKHYEKVLNKVTVILISLFSDQVVLSLLYGELYNGVKMREFIGIIGEWMESTPTINTQSLPVSLYAKSNGNTYPSSITDLYTTIYNKTNTAYTGSVSKTIHNDKPLNYQKAQDVMNQNNTILNHLLSQLWFSKNSTNEGLFGKVNTRVWTGLKIIYKSVVRHEYTKREVATTAESYINQYTQDMLDSGVLPNNVLYSLYNRDNVAKYIRDILMIHSDILFNTEKCDGTPLQPPSREETAKLLAFALFNDLRNLFLLSNIERQEKTLSISEYENITIYANHIHNMKVFMKNALGEDMDIETIRETRFYALYNLMYSILGLVDKQGVSTPELPPRGYKSTKRGGTKMKRYTRKYLREHRPTIQKHKYTRKFI